MAGSSWRLTEAERTRGYTYLAEFAAGLVLGPVGPFAVFAARYLYDRRDQIFSSSGAPVRAFDSTDRPVALSSLALPAAGNGTLSLRPRLSESARRLGVRDGDPVGLVLTGHSYTGARSGLVVPARIGQRVEVAVPRGTYSLGAFAGRQDALFTRPQPFDAVAGRSVVVGARSALSLPLAAGNLKPALTDWRVCPHCKALTNVSTAHSCLVSPGPVPPNRRPPVIRPVVAAPLATPCWWCGYTDPHCTCLVGGVRRFLDDL